MKKFSIAVIGKGACAGIAKYSDTVPVIKKDTGFVYPEVQVPSISLNETYKEINCNNNESFTFTANGTETLPEGSVYLWFTPENSTSSGAYMFSDIMIKEIKDGTFKSHTIHVNSTSNTMYPSCGGMDLPQRYNYFCVFIPRGCGDTYV